MTYELPSNLNYELTPLAPNVLESNQALTKEVMENFQKVWNSNNGFKWRPRTHLMMLPRQLTPSVKVISADEILEGFDG